MDIGGSVGRRPTGDLNTPIDEKLTKTVGICPSSQITVFLDLIGFVMD